MLVGEKGLEETYDVDQGENDNDHGDEADGAEWDVVVWIDLLFVSISLLRLETKNVHARRKWSKAVPHLSQKPKSGVTLKQ